MPVTALNTIEIGPQTTTYVLEDRFLVIDRGRLFVEPSSIQTYDFEGNLIAEVDGNSNLGFGFWHIRDDGDGGFSGFLAQNGQPQGEVVRFDANLGQTIETYEYQTFAPIPQVPSYLVNDWRQGQAATDLGDGRVAMAVEDGFAVLGPDGSILVDVDLPSALAPASAPQPVGQPDVVTSDVVVASGEQVMLLRIEKVTSFEARATEDDAQIYATVINADGSVAVDQFEVTEVDHFQHGFSQEPGSVQTPSATVLENGNVAITWTSATADTQGNAVFLKILAMDGTTVLGQTIISDASQLDSGSSVHATDGGGFVVLYQTVGGAAMQRFQADGTPVGDPVQPFENLDVGTTTIVAPNGSGLIGPFGDDQYTLQVFSVSLEGTGTPEIGTEGTDAADDETLSAGADVFNARDGNDTVYGAGGNDTISGGGGDDELFGGDGEDLMRGNVGEDTLIGGAGDDALRGQKNGDRLEGGAGNDNLKGGGGNDTLIGGEGRDFLSGGTRRDLIDGGDGRDKLIGRKFDDTLIGGAGNDRLNGGGDDDRLTGGLGNDVLKGGLGADTFVFDADFGTYRIIDFDLSEDRLEIAVALADGRTEAEIEALAQQVGNEMRIDFGGDALLRLSGLNDVTGLAGQIDIV